MKTTIIFCIYLLSIFLIGGCGEPIQKDQAGAEPLTMRCMTYNICYGGQAQPAKDWENGHKTSAENRIPLLIDVINSVNPDIVFLQECNGWADNNNQILNEVANSVGMHGIVAPNNGRFLVALLSRYPIESYSWQPDDSIYRWNIVRADITLPGGRKLAVASTHYGWWGLDKWWSPGVTKEEKLAMYLPQTEFLMDVLKENKDIPFIIAGDFNHPDEYHVSLLRENGSHADIPNKLIKQFYPRIKEIGYSDIYQKLNGSYKGKRSCMGFSSGVIDHIFATDSIADGFKHCEIVETPLAFKASDHLPIFADFQLP